eukprot:g15163.t1
MRFTFMLLLFLVLLPGVAASAHPADEFPQVTLEINIDEQAVELVVGIPAKTAMLGVFDGLTPVAMDQMEPVDLAKVIAPVLAARCPLTIDGVVVPPTILEPVVQMENSRQPARRFPLAQVLEQGTLRFIARYETKSAPGRVSLNWSIYSNLYDEADEPIYEDEYLLVAALLAVDQREEFVFLMPMEPEYTWHAEKAAALPAELLKSIPIQRNFLYVPLPSIGLVLAGVTCGAVMLKRSKPRAVGLVVFSIVTAVVCLPYGRLAFEHTPSYTELGDDDALAVFETLHRNIYRAFDYTDEGAVYDALAQSVDGPMLETIYNDVYQSLIMREQNGAVSKVVRVEIDEASLTPANPDIVNAYGRVAFAVNCAWQVDGLVTHFGHTHARTNAFEAVYHVAPRADGWRIVGARILQQQRIDDGSKTAQDIFDDP